MIWVFACPRCAGAITAFSVLLNFSICSAEVSTQKVVPLAVGVFQEGKLRVLYMFFTLYEKVTGKRLIWTHHPSSIKAFYLCADKGDNIYGFCSVAHPII